MIQYLLDTNVVSALVLDPHGPTARRVSTSAVCTSVVVEAELRYGIAKHGSDRLTGKVADLLAALDILPLTSPAAVHYAAIRTRLEREGQIIGRNDLLIAAHCLALDCTLVSANVREFSRVHGLRIENWLS